MKSNQTIIAMCEGEKGQDFFLWKIHELFRWNHHKFVKT
jgi:hypothetical protein